MPKAKHKVCNTDDRVMDKIAQAGSRSQIFLYLVLEADVGDLEDIRKFLEERSVVHEAAFQPADTVTKLNWS